MTHQPLFLHQITVSFPDKICFTDFTTTIQCGSRIALIGKNGTGKSTLLSLISGQQLPTEGTIIKDEGTRIGYVPQLQNSSSLSGGELFNKALSQALRENPSLLLLDEPTNHLDQQNKASLIRMLKKYPGTLLIASHDAELLEATCSTLWHIEHGRISIVESSYSTYLQDKALKRTQVEQKLSLISAHKKEQHSNLMQEQQRAAKSRSYGHTQKLKKKWTSMAASSKASDAEKTTGKRSSALAQEKEELMQQLKELALFEVITPRFFFKSAPEPNAMVVSVRNGSVGYTTPLLQDLHFSLMGSERVALTGANGSGKSTFIKGLLNKDAVWRLGTWHTPASTECGYLDQHYTNLPSQLTVVEAVKEQVDWPYQEVRKHLHDFLFRKNGDIEAPISTLSGGERARLSLALIAAVPPKLLVLDELSNNLDRETLDHTVAVLNNYTGALILVSHDNQLIDALGITTRYQVSNSTLSLDEPHILINDPL